MEAEKEQPVSEQTNGSGGGNEAVMTAKEEIVRDEQSSPEPTKPTPVAVTNDVTVKKPGFGSKLGGWFKANFPFLLIMAKGALPPTIILSMYQSDVISNMLGSLGYLSAITMGILPRANFAQGFWIACIFAALSISIGGLISYCVVKARLHTSKPIPAGASSGNAANAGTLLAVPYNSSAAAVGATWLFFAIFGGTLLRTKFPQALAPGMLFNILLIVICSNAPHFPNMTVTKSFLVAILKAVYIGLGVGCGVSLFIIPISVKSLVVKQIIGLFMGFKSALSAYRELIHHLGSEESVSEALMDDSSKIKAISTLSSTMNGVAAANSRLQVDLPFAKREIGIDKFGPTELKEINNNLRGMIIPLLGLSSIADILMHFSRARGWTPGMQLDEKDQILRDRSIKEWASNMRLVAEPIDKIVDVMLEAVDHIMIQLGMKPRPKKPIDVEGIAAGDAPGEAAFAGRLDRISTEFYATKHLTLIEWAKLRGVDVSNDFFDHPDTAPIQVSSRVSNETVEQHQVNQRQLYMLLYMEYLLHSTSRALLEFVLYVDGLIVDRKLKTRFIIPPFRYLSKIFLNAFNKDDLTNVDSGTIRDVNEGASHVYMGSSYQERRNPEHLPPTNAWERFGDLIRMIPNFLRSPDASFAFRVAVATISCSLPVFLSKTFVWSLQNRVYWASIMTAISMTPTSGQSLFGFTLRLLGTVVAMLLSWVIYYVAGNGKTAGILPLFWFVAACLFSILIKKPQFAQVALIAIVTMTLTIGYELEARKIGTAKLGASGGTFLDILHFGPVRLATVLAGIAVAFFWTIFPYPISEHSVLRRDLGGALYLLGEFYSVVHQTVASRVKGDAGNPKDKHSVGRRLDKARVKTFNKQMIVISELRTYLNFSKFELQIGGKFPRDKYVIIVDCLEKIARYMALVSYASNTFGETNGEDAGISQWAADFRRLMGQINPTTHETVMLLTLLSSCILDGRPLPPYLPHPAPYTLSQRLEQLDGQILSVRHVNEKGYAAFAVMQLAGRCIGSDFEILLAAMKDIVGTMDYSYSIVPDSDVDIPQVDNSGQNKSTFKVDG